jgi:hypothetical protein
MTERSEAMFVNPFGPNDITTVSQKDISRLGGKILAAPPLSSKIESMKRSGSKKSSVASKIKAKSKNYFQHDFHRDFGHVKANEKRTFKEGEVLSS